MADFPRGNSGPPPQRLTGVPQSHVQTEPYYWQYSSDGATCASRRPKLLCKNIFAHSTAPV
eukprot:7294956-Alexandrium_andersonii.AAC.1